MTQPKKKARMDCPYLDTVNRAVLDCKNRNKTYFRMC